MSKIMNESVHITANYGAEEAFASTQVPFVALGFRYRIS